MGASAATAPAGCPPPSTPAPPRLASRWPRLRSGADTGAAGVVARYAVIGVPLVLGLLAWRGASYWEYSKGVYALTARMILGGAGLYGKVVAAQPPLLFLAGAGLLALHDSLEALRATLALPLLATGLLVALAVWRLTASRLAAASGGLAALVAPWTQ